MSERHPRLTSKRAGWVERSDTHHLMFMRGGFRKRLNPPYELNSYDEADAGQQQPWPECGVTGRITPTGVVGGFVKPRLPNPL